MFNFVRKNNLKPSLNESYKYFANNLISLSENSGSKVFVFTSTNSKPGFLRKISEKLVSTLAEKNVNVLFVKSEFESKKVTLFGKIQKFDGFDFLKLVNVSQKKFEEFISENGKNYDMILVFVPPMILKADALEYAKVCDGTILVEKYGDCYYSNYENMLLTLKLSNVKILGVLTVC